MQQIVPHIWFNRTAEAAGEWYASLFPGGVSRVEGRYQEEGLPEFQRELAGAALTVSVEIPDPAGEGEPTKLALINAGDEFRPAPSFSFMLNFDPLMFGGEAAARDALETLWEGLRVGGRELMPLGEYPFSAQYAWVEDRYGVSWQLMLTQPEGEPRPFVIPAIMFDGDAQDRAAEAADDYVSLFAARPGGAAVGKRWPYGVATGKAGADALAFGEFRIGSQWFMASDNGSGVDHGLSCGVSLAVWCEDQAEIDRIWSALSAVPEAERCGWLTDQYGVSWQVLPENLGELMSRPGAYEKLMGMGKIVIAEL